MSERDDELIELTGDYTSFEEAFRTRMEDWGRLPRLILSEEEARRFRATFKDAYSWPMITGAASSADWIYKPTVDILPDGWDDNESTPVVHPDLLGDSYLLVVLTDIFFFILRFSPGDRASKRRNLVLLVYPHPFRNLGV